MPEIAYSVTRVSYSSELTFLLELGHNMGNQHSRNQTQNPAPKSGGLFEYSTGWKWEGTDLPPVYVQMLS